MATFTWALQGGSLLLCCFQAALLILVRNRPLQQCSNIKRQCIDGSHCWSSNHHCNTVRTFVNVFKMFFDILNIDEHFDVNMCIKHLGKVGVVGHHPSIVICKAIWSLSKHLTIVLPTIDKVTVFALCCLLEESLRITFFAYIVDHAWVCWGIIGCTICATNIL